MEENKELQDSYYKTIQKNHYILLQYQLKGL